MANIKHHRDSSNIVQFRGRGVRAQLREALEARGPVQLARERITAAWVHGYVIGLSAEFCLIAEVSDAMRFDGFLAVAVSDVSAGVGAKILAANSSSARWRFNEETLPELPGFKLDDWQAIAESAALQTPLVSLNMLDEADGEVSYIGRLTGTEHDALVMQEVDPNAHWYPDTGSL